MKNNMFAKWFAKLFPMFIVKIIHQVAGTKKGDKIVEENSPIIGAIVQAAQSKLSATDIKLIDVLSTVQMKGTI